MSHIGRRQRRQRSTSRSKGRGRLDREWSTSRPVGPALSGSARSRPRDGQEGGRRQMRDFQAAPTRDRAWPTDLVAGDGAAATRSIRSIGAARTSGARTPCSHANAPCSHAKSSLIFGASSLFFRPERRPAIRLSRHLRRAGATAAPVQRRIRCAPAIGVEILGESRVLCYVCSPSERRAMTSFRPLLPPPARCASRRPLGPQIRFKLL